MRGYKLFFGILAIMSVIISGCSLMVSNPANEDQVCVSKDTLAKLNISVDKLLETENASIVKQVPEQTLEGDNITQIPVQSGSEIKPVGEKPADVVDSSGILTKTYIAGEVVSLKPKATDADNDKISFTYSLPLDINGEWKTKEGNEGEYLVTITASDGKIEVSKQVKIIIIPANTAPVINDIAPITVKEGDTVKLEPVVFDNEGDDITISYTGWMTEPTKKATRADVGTQKVMIKASDGKAETIKTITITVLKLNHAPVISELEPITVIEGDLVELNAKATDPDGENVTITYSAPLDSTGKWQTQLKDAGTYTVTVTATDGELSDRKTVSVEVKSANSAPVVKLDDVSLILNKVGTNSAETKTVTLNPVVSDADGDKVTLTYSGFMTSNTKVVTEDDKGQHIVTVIADDGKTTSTINIMVTVEVNNAPVIDLG